MCTPPNTAAAMHPPTDKETAGHQQHRRAHNPGMGDVRGGLGREMVRVRLQLGGLSPEVLLMPGHTEDLLVWPSTPAPGGCRASERYP
ncbi:hypothetical protein AB4305_25835 [Nocardia sp. 2YAB30]|uniref:hypothetical protein n=1 Tax=Nocardia sp. 2YAB30 TaxID=3233022 RepID=UPI003F944C1F